MPSIINANVVVRTSLTACFFGICSGALADEIILDRDQFSAEIGQRQSSFLALDLDTGARCILAGSDLETRHAPWSTFKIPNFLIALETGVAESVEAWRDWDPALRPAAEYWPDAWRQGQTLQSAFRYSTVWYFQDLALEVGALHYRQILSDWGYGNVNVPDGSDSFWLGGPLAISVSEQVQFLQRLLTDDLSVSHADLAAFTETAEAGRVGTLALYGKTGSGPVHTGQFSGPFEGWYVGWLGQGGSASVVFAHQVWGEDFSSIRTYRQDFAEVLLQACGYS